MSSGEGTVLLLEFREQPHVLDRDDRLVGEGFEELYLLARKWSCGFAADRDHSNRVPVPQHRYGKDASVVVGTREGSKLVLPVLTYVGDMDEGPGQDGAMGATCPPWTRRVRITIGGRAFLGHVMRSNKMDQLTVEREGGTQLGVAQGGGAGVDAVEYRLDIVGGARDDPQDVAGGGLLLQRLGQSTITRLQLREQAHVLDSNDRLVGEGLEERDLLFVEGLGLRPPEGHRSDRLARPQKRQCDLSPRLQGLDHPTG